MGLTKVLDFSDYLQTVWECLPAVDPGSESCVRTKKETQRPGLPACPNHHQRPGRRAACKDRIA
ncbi:hypothetical protein J6590_073867 [Homalodisca vitripennis]|nr:hypothetical protein J6590_073867 [Homalodisca vitripennis]